MLKERMSPSAISPRKGSSGPQRDKQGSNAKANPNALVQSQMNFRRGSPEMGKICEIRTDGFENCREAVGRAADSKECKDKGLTLNNYYGLWDTEQNKCLIMTNDVATDAFSQCGWNTSQYDYIWFQNEGQIAQPSSLLRPSCPLPEQLQTTASKTAIVRQDIGLPGTKTLHMVLPEPQATYVQCATKCSARDPSDPRKPEYPVSLFFKSAPTDQSVQQQMRGLGIEPDGLATGPNCLCVQMRSDESLDNLKPLPNILGSWGNCSVVSAPSDDVVLTVSVQDTNLFSPSLDDPYRWAKSVLSTPCPDPIDRFNTLSQDLCPGIPKVGEDPWSFKDANGTWWQGTWCGQKNSSPCWCGVYEDTPSVCQNEAVNFAEGTSHDYWRCVGADSYDKRFTKDERQALQDFCQNTTSKAWQDELSNKIVPEFGCDCGWSGWKVLCARPYPQ